MVTSPANALTIKPIELTAAEKRDPLPQIILLASPKLKDGFSLAIPGLQHVRPDGRGHRILLKSRQSALDSVRQGSRVRLAHQLAFVCGIPTTP
jgi:hypothetical protein